LPETIRFFPHPDPTAYALNMWATFEAMINLLKPEAMAGLMADLLPEMIEAMPGPFPAMMKWMKNTSPGMRDVMLTMMRPMMPKMEAYLKGEPSNGH